MSKIDSSLSPELRQLLLDEVRSHLPAFLSATSTERYNPVDDVAELLNLARADLQAVIAVHLSRRPEVQEFVAALPAGLRRPNSEGERTHEESPIIRGQVDWGRTVRYRAARGGVDQRFVLRRNSRQFDLAENRALLWAIESLEREFSRLREASEAVPAGWRASVEEMRSTLAAARRTSWLRQLTPTRPTPEASRRMHASRTALYAYHLPRVLDALARWCDEPTPTDIADLLAERYFEPSRDWQLFEIAVALRLARGVASVATGKRRAHLLSGGGRRPYATYIVHGATVRLWYQAWPRKSGASHHSGVSRRFEIKAGSPRPDLVVEFDSGTQRWAIVVECKASSSPSYLSAGIFQLIGYLADRPLLFNRPTPGWLVAPASEAFVLADPAGLLVRVLDADTVAAALIDALDEAPELGSTG